MPLAALAAPYAAVVMDARSGEIIFARNHDTRLHPASLTKMMTLYIAFEAVKNGEITLDTQVTISRNAASEPCSCLGLRAGQKIALRYLIRAAAVRSGNDAATAIGEAISGSEAAFAERMTRTARAMGMNNTTFKNAHGLTHRDHLSTARDMTILGRQLFFDYPQYYNLFSRRSTDAGVANVVNTNRRFLDAYRGADGIKTGFTNAAGFNLVGSAERGGKRIIATVFGGNSVAHRNAQMAELLDIGFSRSPARVAVSRPPAPNYAAVGRAPQTGRTIRVTTTTVTRSPVPPPRAPAAPSEEVLLALQEGIGAALAEAQADSAAEAVVAASATAVEVPAVAPAVRPEAIVADVGLVDGGDEEMGDGEGDSDGRDHPVGGPDVKVQVVGMTDEAAAPVPALRSDADIAPIATAAAPQASDIDAAVSTAAAPEAAAIPDAVVQALAQADAAAPDIPDTPAVSPAPQILLTSSTPPPRPAEEYVFAAAQGQSDPASRSSEPTEILTRHVSTSDARIWGVNVGRYGSRFEAERVLMQTALADMTALEGTLRKVQPVSGGFDATFLGMTRDQADLACRRLQARDRLCFTMGP